jgi:hypothetical protein
MLDGIRTLHASTRFASLPVFSMTSPLALILTMLVLWKRSATSPVVLQQQQPEGQQDERHCYAVWISPRPAAVQQGMQAFWNHEATVAACSPATLIKQIDCSTSNKPRA